MHKMQDKFAYIVKKCYLCTVFDFLKRKGKFYLAQKRR